MLNNRSISRLQLTRRHFVTKLVLVSFLPVSNLNAKTSKGTSDSSWFDISFLKLTLPKALINKRCSRTSRVLVQTVIENRASQESLILFADHLHIRFNSHSSVQSILKQHQNRPSKESMLFKRLISSALDASYAHIANKRHPEKGSQLNSDFDQLQTQAVLESVTLSALGKLLVVLLQAQTVSAVSWDAAEKRFEVE